MKNLLFPLAVAAFCGLPVASALNADNARVTLDVSGGGDLRVESVTPMTIFGGKDAKQSRGDKSTTWQYVTIPVKVEAKCKGDSSPNFVDELKFHVYAVFGSDKGADPIMLDKEITYVDIPVNAKSGGKLSEGHMNVGVFISPANASKIMSSGKVELGDKLIAVAIEASFHDSPCVTTDSEPYFIVDSKFKQKLTGAWWKKSSNAKNKAGAELSAISETPFAPFYAPVFPPTKPMYGPAAAGSLSGSSTGSSSTDTDDTTTPETDTAAATDEDTTTAATTTGSSKKKSKKK